VKRQRQRRPPPPPEPTDDPSPYATVDWVAPAYGRAFQHKPSGRNGRVRTIDRGNFPPGMMRALNRIANNRT